MMRKRDLRRINGAISNGASVRLITKPRGFRGRVRRLRLSVKRWEHGK